MSQVINTNVASLNAQRNLQSSQSSLATSLQRLSSGLRINSAKDDAAGLAISERFTTQIRGINQAIRNANDGISLAQVGESALAEVTTNLQRIRELAVQSANATNSDSDRAALDLEVQQRLAEIDRVASQTAFNGRKLLDGSFGNATFQIGAEAGQSINLNLGANASTRLSAIGQVAQTTTAGAIGASSTGGSNTVSPSSLTFGTAGSVDGSLTVSASNRLFGETGVSDTKGLVIANADFTTETQDGSNTQTLVPSGGTIDLSAPGALAQFDVNDGALTVGITLNGNYATGGDLATAINTQLGATASTVTAAYDGATNSIKFTNSGANQTTAVVISGADANSVDNLGIANSAGTAGGTVGAQFSVDGVAITLNTNLSADAATFAGGIQTALNTAAAGTYTVELSGSDIVIRNNNAGSSAVAITGANDIAVAAGITNSAGTTAANPATEGTFQIENGATDIDITLDENYADFDALAAAIQTQLDTAAAGTFSVTNNAGSISIARDAGGVVQINSANGRASGAGFGPTSGVITTNASFDVDDTTVTLATDYADYDAMATDIGTQLGSGYTVTNDSGTISIVNNTPGSSGVVISNADANALAAGITESAGTDGIGEGSVTLSDFSINGVSVTGSFASADDLATAINTSVSGVFATVNNGALSLSSSQAITLGGADATGALGFASTSIEANSGSLSGGNVQTVADANAMIQRIDSALTSVSTFRSTFGAIQNRFESVTANLTSSVENLSASRSRILDADFAAETANLTRAQILQQAGVAMLAQANALPQNVLSLLR